MQQQRITWEIEMTDPDWTKPEQIAQNIREEIWNTLGHSVVVGRALSDYGMFKFNQTVQHIVKKHLPKPEAAPAIPQELVVEMEALVRAHQAFSADAVELVAKLDALNKPVDPLAEATLADVFEQAKHNHQTYSATGSQEQDIRFFALGLAGEAGEVANFVKKRWRDGDGHDADLRKECADVFAYNIMLAWALGMTPQDLIDTVLMKQREFVAKMEAKRGLAIGKGEAS